MAVIDFPGQDPNREDPFPLSVVDVSTAAFLISLPEEVLKTGKTIRILDVSRLLDRCRAQGQAEPRTGLRALAGYFRAGGAEAIVMNVGTVPVLTQALLSQLDPFETVAFVVAPGYCDVESQRRLVAWCHKSRRALALLDHEDAEPVADPLGFAAAFGPALSAEDPLSGTMLPTPVSGHVAGTMVRLTAQHGVGRSLKGATVPGVAWLSGDDNLQLPDCVNAMVHRDGNTLIGSDRTLAEDGDWQSLSVRRLGTLIERTFSAMGAHTVDEPNRSLLWARARLTAERFMAGLHRNGGLAGDLAKDAYHVQAGGELTTAADIARGQFILRVGFAPLKPAEFVTIDITLPARPG